MIYFGSVDSFKFSPIWVISSLYLCFLIQRVSYPLYLLICMFCDLHMQVESAWKIDCGHLADTKPVRWWRKATYLLIVTKCANHPIQPQMSYLHQKKVQLEQMCGGIKWHLCAKLPAKVNKLLSIQAINNPISATRKLSAYWRHSIFNEFVGLAACQLKLCVFFCSSILFLYSNFGWMILKNVSFLLAKPVDLAEGCVSLISLLPPSDCFLPHSPIIITNIAIFLLFRIRS